MESCFVLSKHNSANGNSDIIVVWLQWLLHGQGVRLGDDVITRDSTCGCKGRYLAEDSSRN